MEKKWHNIQAILSLEEQKMKYNLLKHLEHLGSVYVREKSKMKKEDKSKRKQINIYQERREEGLKSC